MGHETQSTVTCTNEIPLQELPDIQPSISNNNGEEAQAEAYTDIESEFPAWICVLGSFAFLIPSYGELLLVLSNMTPHSLLTRNVLGFMNSIGTVQSYLQLNQLKEYSGGEVGWIPGMYVFLSLFLNIQVGPLFDHFGPRVFGPIGIAITTACFLLLAECKTYWQFMLCLGVFGAFGGAINAIIAIAVVGKLFVRRRGLAMGIALSGAAVGSIIFPIMLRSTFPDLGWRWSMRIMALVCAGLMIPGLICFLPFQRLVRTGPNYNPNKKLGAAFLNFSAFKSPTFSFVALGLFLLEFVIFGISGLLPTVAISAGFTPGNGYTLLSIVGGASCIGRIIPGLLGDIVGHFNVFLVMIATTIVMMSAVFVPFGTSKPALYAFAALWGFGSGSFLSIAPGE